VPFRPSLLLSEDIDVGDGSEDAGVRICRAAAVMGSVSGLSSEKM